MYWSLGLYYRVKWCLQSLFFFMRVVNVSISIIICIAIEESSLWQIKLKVWITSINNLLCEIICSHLHIFLLYQLLSFQDKTRPPLTLMEFPPLAHYMNGLVAMFNTLRQCCPVATLPQVLSLLQKSLSKVKSLSSLILIIIIIDTHIHYHHLFSFKVKWHVS